MKTEHEAQTETPRTDALNTFCDGCVSAHFARTLERELAASLAEGAALTAERDRLKEQVAEWGQKDTQRAEDEAGEDL